MSQLNLLRGVLLLLLITGSMSLVAGYRNGGQDARQKPGTTPVRPGGSGGVVVTYAPAQPPVRATATPAFTTVVINLPQPAVTAAVNSALNSGQPRLLALLEGAHQRRTILIAQQALLEDLTAPPINAVLLSRTIEEANTLTVRVPPGRVSLIQELSGIASVTPVQPAPGDNLTDTPPVSLTSRPVDQPRYPVRTVEAR
jgi:hypothetical protein